MPTFEADRIVVRDASGGKRVVYANEPRPDLEDRLPKSRLVPLRGIGLAALRLRIEAVLDRSCAEPTLAALARLPAAETASVLLKVANASSPYHCCARRQAAAVAALGLYARPDVVDFLAALLVDAGETLPLRALAAESLGRIGSTMAVSHLLGCLRDRRVALRQAAARALGRAQSPQAVEALLRVARADRAPAVRQEAAMSLRALEKRWGIRLGRFPAPRRRRAVRVPRRAGGRLRYVEGVRRG
jgi:hypothetical protein